MSSQSRKQKKEAELASYGRVTADAVFGTKFIKIYDKGYVRVAGLLGAPVEKLVNISGSADVTKKSGLGRTLAAGATMGLSLASPNKRGDAYLTIVTESQTHSLHVSPPTQGDMRALHTLVAAGEAAIAQRPESMPAGSQYVDPAQSTSIIDQLSRLGELRSSGVLTEDEFIQLKNRLLGSGDETAGATDLSNSVEVTPDRVNVVLLSSPEKSAHKIEQIKVLKETLNLELKAAKNAIDNPPSVLMSGVSLADARRVADQLKAAGIDVELQ